jgi:hypothetical protein
VSGEIEIRCCVPQGSNLGTTMASTFADDTNLSCSGQTSADIEYKINKDLDNIRKWIISNKSTLNIGKTEYMIIGSKPRLDAISETLKIIYGDYQLKRIKEKKFLGFIIDDQLKWNEHNNEQCKTISKSIALLRNAMQRLCFTRSISSQCTMYCFQQFGMVITVLTLIIYSNYKRELHV